MLLLSPAAMLGFSVPLLAMVWCCTWAWSKDGHGVVLSLKIFPP